MTEEDWLYFFGFMFGLFALHKTLLYFIIRPLSKKYVLHEGELGDPELYKLPPTAEELQKFEVVVWRFVYYAINLIAGIWVMKDEDWIYDRKLIFFNWPHAPFSKPLRIYYIWEFCTYLYASITIFVEPKQRDFYQMLLHHVTTLLLIGFSFIQKYERIGVSVMYVFDFADPFLEFAKSFLYCGFLKVADTFFALFTITFFITRVLIFPYQLLRTAMFDANTATGLPVPWRDHSVTGLIILQFLNLFWFFLILKIVFRVYLTGKMKRGDVRDSDYKEVGIDEYKEGLKNNSKNGQNGQNGQKGKEKVVKTD